jgi:hypothetical protein
MNEYARRAAAAKAQRAESIGAELARKTWRRPLAQQHAAIEAIAQRHGVPAQYLRQIAGL